MHNSYDDDIARCPYNKNHIVSTSKLQRHIVKCEKNYPPDYKVICPYNATHRVSKDEIKEHIDTCATRKIFEASYIQGSITHDRTREQNSICEEVYEERKMRVFENITRSISTEQDDQSTKDDMESLISTMGMGRGKLRNNPKFLDTSLGRGKPLHHRF